MAIIQTSHKPFIRNRSWFYLCVSVFLCGSISFLPALPIAAQEWFRTGTGLGVTKPRVAVADFAPKSPTSQPMATEFSDVVRADLDYSGILDLVSKSFNPLQTPSAPSEVDFAGWSAAPASTQ